MSAEEIGNAIKERSKEIEEKLPEVRWIRSYYSAEEGKLYCEYEAPSVDLVFEHGRMMGVPVESAVVVQNLEPSMFW